MDAKILKHAADQYGVPVAHLTPLPGGHFSHVYEFSKGEQSYILRLTPPNEEIDARSMRAILEWVYFLSIHGAPVASPIPSRDHQLIETIEQDGQTYLAVLFEKAKILEIVRGLPKDRDNYGMIHADFHGGNFFVDVESKTITVFDFDDCCCGWYAMDIAMSLFDILVLYSGQEPQRFAAWFLENYLLGYSGKNGLSPFWIDRLPLFLKLLETGVYTQVYRFYEGSVPDSWVGKFMVDRKERIEGDVPYIDIDFTGIYKRALAMRNPQA